MVAVIINSIFQTLSGSVAGVVDIGTQWVMDLKDGICPQAFWFNKLHCCWSSNQSFFEDDIGKCTQVIFYSSHRPKYSLFSERVMLA